MGCGSSVPTNRSSIRRRSSHGIEDGGDSGFENGANYEGDYGNSVVVGTYGDSAGNCSGGGDF